MKKIEILEAVPRVLVGDGQRPNIFFVSKQPEGLMVISRDFTVAYNYWQGLPRNVASELEDRLTGTICSTELSEDGTRYETRDDTRQFKYIKRPQEEGQK